ncbi:MAG TPA: universal stress protein [Anaeromyxobacteraceae bacterium]|nr:universal stress protein [Anaeromyxobacteraceae bacterium]
MASAWKKIACAVDFSVPSRVAMEQAAALAREHGASLALVNVFEPPPAVAADMLDSPLAFEALATEAEELLAAWKADAARATGADVSVRRLTGDPAVALAKLAREGGCDLLVLGTHGRRGLGHLILGSVAERVVHEAPCSVLVVRRSTGAA